MKSKDIRCDSTTKNDEVEKNWVDNWDKYVLKATLTHQKTEILENVNKCSHRNEKLRREDKSNGF